MNTLKRKLTAILLTFAMLFSLMPALPQTAEAAEGNVRNDYILYEYETSSSAELFGHVDVIVQDSNGNQLGETLQIDNYYKTYVSTDSITVLDDNYEIEDIQVSDGVVTRKDVKPDQSTFAWTFSGDSATLTITLCEPYQAPEIKDPIGYSAVSYHISYNQLLKMMYVNGITDVSETTQIKSVQPIWVNSFAMDGVNFSRIDGTVGDTYWNLQVSGTTKDDVEPYNIRFIEIAYDNGDGEQVTKVPASALRFTGIKGEAYYRVESNNDDVHAVAFYNESDLNTADQYDLYAIRFVVDPDQNIGEENMPEDPVYNEALTDYKFVNWEIDAYYGDNGEAFLATTIVDRDMNVYAHKVSSSYSGGTYIRLMNNYDGEINQLIDRLVEGYNDKYNANILADQIDESTIKVRVYGVNNEYTNENYYSNDWSGTEYYLVHNYDAPGVSGGIDVNQNTHVGFNEVSSVTVYFSLNGEKDIATIEIPVGNNAGDLAKMMKGVGADHILQLYVIQEGQVVSGESEDPDPEPPVEPTIDELRSLIEVAVNCQADEEHNKGSNAGTYALAEDTYDVIVDPDTNTATVTVQGQPYVNLLTKDFGVHQISGDISKQVVVKYTDEGWVLNDPSAATPMVLTFSATCSGGTTPEPGDSITAFTKDVVTAEVTEPALEIPEDVKISYPAGENNTVTAHEGDNVTLLYKITVEGKKDTTFTVKDDGAIFVGVSSDVEVTGESNEFTATIPEGGKVDLYVIKTFTDIKLDASPLTNNASIEIEGEGTIGPEEEIIEEVPVEVIPDGPTDEELEALNLKVKLDCVSNVGHSDGTYDLTAASCSYEKDEIVAGENGIYTVPVVVDSEAYLAQYNKDHPDGKHIIKPETSDKQTITLTFTADKKTWLAEGVTSPIAFQVICSGTDAYDINNFTKTLVAGTEAEAEAAAAGVAVESYTIPEPNATVVVPADGSVTLLYKMTVTGNNNKDVNFVVTDKGATLASPESAGVRQEGNTFKGIVSAGKDVTFYVSKTFVVKDINDEDMLVNLATIAGLGEDKDSTVDPGVDEITEEVPGEEGPALPTEQEINDLFDVELDCISGVGHKNQTYEDLVYNKEMFKNYNKAADGRITVEMTVAGTDYLEKFNEASGNVAHAVDGEKTKTITLTYDSNNKAWTAPEGSSPIEFDVKCSGTGDYDINGIAKDLVAGDDDKTAARNNGVENLDSFTIPEAGEKVIIPAGESVTLLYSITVTGNDEKEVKFVVTDKDTTLVPSSAAVTQKDDGTYTATIPAGESVTFYVSKEFTGADINEEDKLVNTASVDGADEGTTVDPDDDVSETVDAEEAISVTPADITIYMGGEQGYEAVVGENGEILGDANNSLPEPGFTVTLPEKLEGTNVTGLTFTEVGGTRTWTFAPYDGKDTTTVYKLVPAEGQEATRVIFTDKEDGHTIVSDEFTVGLEVNTSFDMALYKGAGETAVGDIETTIGEKTYAVDSDNIGELTVRGTTEDVQFADANDDATSAEAPELDVDDNTTFTINDSNVLVTDEEGIALLFDEVINNNGEDRTGLLEDKADDVLNVDADEMSYDFKYLDLVDTHNGNTWVKASDDVTIYWPLPEGTDADTDFTLLHFKDLHREMQSEEEIQQQIENCDVETDATTGTSIEIVEVTDEYVVLKTGETGFSPFALAWETDNGGSDTPGGDDPWYPPYNPGDDDKPSGLNTEDHFSYVVGYEDGMVKPQRSITRAEVATIFYRLLEDDVRDDYDTTRNNFSDVTSDSWYNQTVSTLASMGILKGYEDGTFRPNASITRAEFAAIATRFFEETGATYEPGTFTDVTGDEWFAGAIMDAVNLGLIGGYEDGTVRPNNNITRAEACAIVNRTLGRVPDADHLLPADEMTTWPDNPSSAWFYADMQEATNGHEYEWITEDGNKIEEWTDILDKDWNDR